VISILRISDYWYGENALSPIADPIISTTLVATTLLLPTHSGVVKGGKGEYLPPITNQCTNSAKPCSETVKPSMSQCQDMQELNQLYTFPFHWVWASRRSIILWYLYFTEYTVIGSVYNQYRLFSVHSNQYNWKIHIGTPLLTALVIINGWVTQITWKAN